MIDNEKVAGQSTAPSDTCNDAHPAEAENTNFVDNISGAIGRFKDAKGLLDAYNSLQSEFTRRCQRVKELERELEKIKSSEQAVTTSEKFSKGEECKGFLSKFPEAREHIESLYTIAENKGDESYGRLERALITKLKDELTSQYNYFTSNDYLTSALMENNQVKEKVIRDYLDTIYATKSKIPLISGDGKACITPPSNPKNLQEAGKIAKQIFDKYKENL